MSHYSTKRPVRVFGMFRNNETMKWERRLEHEQGWLHQFGMDVEEDEQGFSTFSIAIVELPGGEVIMPRADRIEFLDWSKA